MQVGFEARTPGTTSDAEELAALVVEGEALGFDYTTIFDHMVLQRSLQAKYNNSSESDSTSITYGRCHEQLTTIAFLAGKTERIRFVTAIMVVPYRPPVLAAKMLSTIDVLSGGRLTVGAGTGWIKGEFDALGVPFGERGRLTDEYLQIFKRLWTEDAVDYEGPQVRLEGVGLEPKPTQKPYPPIWVGGMSMPAMRRAARYGDAWYPMMNDQAEPLDSLELLGAASAKLRALAEAEGREPDVVRIAVRVAQHGDHLATTASDGNRRLFAGPLENYSADLASLRDLGIAAVDFRFEANRAERVVEDMQTFQRAVLAKV